MRPRNNLPTTALFVVLGLVTSTACSTARTPEGPSPEVVVAPIAPSAASATAAPEPAPARSAGGEGCSEGFVEVIDGNQTVRYRLGRELVAGVRGAKHAYGEAILHHNGSVVLHVEGIARPDGHQGHLSLSITGFREPPSLPAAFDEARVEYMAPGLERERDERTLASAHVEITSWGAEGGWIEGTFGPSVSAATPSASAPYRGRFRVCRSPDWRPRI